jgi:transcriptional regulator with PAS, ATPase and Fis domain
MPLDLQTKLLRVFQERKITKLGDTKEIPIDIRIIAATNENPEEAVEKGAFRMDLFYRLNVLYLTIPPLRERIEDISILFSHFVKYFSKQLNINIVIPKPTVLRILNSYSWPGNVRELQNFAERFTVFCTIKKNPNKVLEELFNKYYGNKQLNSMEKYKSKSSSKTHDLSLTDVINYSERQLLLETGKKVQWNKTKMCQLLGISKATLWRKMKKADLSAH